MAATPAPAPTVARGLLPCCLSPGAPEEAAAAEVVPTPPRAPPLFLVSVCEGRGRRRRCGGSRRRRRCCCHCQVASEGEAVAANMFSVRIVTADYYMASPLQGLDICQSPLTQVPVKKVPVVRVFGATPAGKRAGAGAGGAPGPPSPPRSRAHAAGSDPLRGSVRVLPPQHPPRLFSGA